MSKQRRLGFESLETRRVCAGDVSATVIGGELVISGDNASNYVQVRQQTVGGVEKFVVSGKPFGGAFTRTGNPIARGPLTTINGATTPFRVVADSVRVDTNRGNDAIVIGGAGQATQAEQLQVIAGKGRDYVRVANVQVTSDSATAANIDMTQGQGRSVPGQRELGADKLVLNSISIPEGSLTIATGGGADKIFATNISVPGDGSAVKVYAGNGPDIVTVQNADLNKAVVVMGNSAQRDVVRVRSVNANEVYVYLGRGNRDLLELVANVRVARRTVLNGGPGSGDRLKVASTVSAAGRSITGFEIKPFGL